MTGRGLTARMPIWLRVAGIIALVLVGVWASAMLLEAVDIGGGRGSHSPGPTPTDGGGHGPGGGDTTGGRHGSGGVTRRSDHDGGQGGYAAPASRDPGAVSVRVAILTMNRIVLPPVKAAAHSGGPA